MDLFRWSVLLIRGLCVPKAVLAAENTALRQQLAVYKRRTRRSPRLRLRDRLFWIVISRWWPGWKAALVIVQPATVCRWHRAGFRLFWHRKSLGGRPRIDRELRDLIRRIAAENPLWGVPRIRAELKLLGHRIAEATIAKYLPSQSTGPRRINSGTWTAFWKNHAAEIAAIDFFVVPTATFRLFYVFLVLSPDRRRVVHFNVTCNPSASWTARQIIEAFPFDSVPKYLVRDNDRIFGREFSARVEGMGIEEIPTPSTARGRTRMSNGSSEPFAANF